MTRAERQTSRCFLRWGGGGALPRARLHQREAHVVGRRRGCGRCAGAPAVAHPYGASACGTCVAAQCSVAVTACGEDPECASFLECLDACPIGASGDVDAACAARCPAPTGTAGQQAKATLDACRAGTAAIACAACGDPPPDGGLIPLLEETCPPSQETDPCLKCDHESCCTIDDACTASKECSAIIDCLNTATTTPEVLACVNDHPGGAGIFAQRFACRDVHCTNTVACLGKPPGACAVCEVTQCPDVFAELVGTPDGLNLLYGCVLSGCQGLTNPDQYVACLQTCKGKFPAAGLAFDDFFLCASTRCDCL